SARPGVNRHSAKRGGSARLSGGRPVRPGAVPSKANARGVGRIAPPSGRGRRARARTVPEPGIPQRIAARRAERRRRLRRRRLLAAAGLATVTAVAAILVVAGPFSGSEGPSPDGGEATAAEAGVSGRGGNDATHEPG